MKLRAYLIDREVSYQEFADLIGISKTYLIKIMCGTFIPGYHLLVRIENQTGGKVKAEDFKTVLCRKKKRKKRDKPVQLDLYKESK